MDLVNLLNMARGKVEVLCPRWSEVISDSHINEDAAKLMFIKNISELNAQNTYKKTSVKKLDLKISDRFYKTVPKFNL